MKVAEKLAGTLAGEQPSRQGRINIAGRRQPVAVTGGLTFSAIAAMSVGESTCGVSMNGAVYCWGKNGLGQLGNGTTANSDVPVKVAGQP